MAIEDPEMVVGRSRARSGEGTAAIAASLLSLDELGAVNRTNADFGSGDSSAFSTTGKPLYMRVPNGDRVKKLLGTSVTTVYP